MFDKIFIRIFENWLRDYDSFIHQIACANESAFCNFFYCFVLIILLQPVFYPIKYRLLDSHSVIQKATKVGKSFRQKFTTVLVFTFIIVFASLIIKSPAAVGLFWVSSNSLHLIECIILDSIKFRRLVGIPKTNLEPNNIYLFKYAVILNGFKKILKRFKK